MNVVEFLATLSEQRVSVWTEGDRLRYRAPEGVLTPVLLEQLKQHKADIVAWLHERDSNTALLSFGQRALWFLYQLAPQSPAYNLMHAARLPSDLDAGVLRQAVGQLIDRHPVLRTTFTVMSGEPIQQIHNDPPEGYFEVIDAAGWHHEEINTRLEMMADRPFDLEQGPVMRLQLFENAPAANGQGQSYILLLTVHHIAVDFISLQVLLYELMTLYQAIKAGTPPSLPDLTSEYRDYVRWERDKLRADGDTLANYWHNQLGHAGSGKAPLPSLNLPTDYPRPALQTYAGDSYTFELDTILAQRLSDLAKANGTTLYTTLLAAFQIFLYRYTGQDDIPIGTPMDTRSLSQFERVVGYFANPVVLRADLSKNPTFTQHLKQVRQTVIEAVKHRDYPFPLLVDQLQQARDPGRSPLFQVAFAWDQFLPQELTPAGLPVETLAFGQRGSEFDLTLTILNMGGSLKGNLRFNLDLFEPATIQRMVGHLQTLLGGIVAYPEACIAALPLLTEAERHRLLFEWNDTGTDYPSDQCIQQLFETHVERTPQAVAVVYGDQTLTYKELNEQANRLAHHLNELDVGPESLVGICLERSVELIVGLLAILKAGGAYVPLDPTYPPERLAFMGSDARLSLIMTRSSTDPLPKNDQLTTVYLDRLSDQLSREPAHNPKTLTTPDNLAYVMYTSGSTGRPKGTVTPHRGVVRLVKKTTYADFSPDSVFLHLAPISFDASTFEIWGALLNGARLVVAPPHSPSLAELGQLIANEQVTTLWLTAGLFQLMVDEQLDRLKPLKQLLAGGDVLSVPHVQRAMKVLESCQLINGYGPTESTTFTCCYPVNPADQFRASVPIGRPIANTQVYILDRHLQPVPIGVPGELYIGGDGLARGYLNKPALTAERFIPNPFNTNDEFRRMKDESNFTTNYSAVLYKTGDLARYRPDGNIEFLGRLDDQVKIRGFRIEPGEIETVLKTHAAVQTCCVVVRQDLSGKSLIAYWVLNGEQEEPQPGTLRTYLSQTLPDYMVPKAFVQLEALPLTPNGKIDRRALPAPELQAEADYVPPRTEAEKILVSIWGQVLGIKQIGIHDNFFEMGGDSILSLQIISQARLQGLHLTPQQVFQHQTIAGLASVATTTSPIQAEQGLVLGAVPLTPVQHWFFEQKQPEPHHFNQAVLLKVPATATPAYLEQAVKHLLIHHDALRLRFELGEADWHSTIIHPGEQIPFSVSELSHLSPAEQEAAIEARAADLQASLNLSDGPLLRVVLFKLDPAADEARLLIIIHHLVVDGVSWRILLEDMEIAYQQISRAQAVQLPPKSTSFKYWAERLAQYQALEEVAYWSTRSNGAAALPTDHSLTGNNTVNSAATVSVSLSREQTEALLRQVPPVYHTQVNDLLLAALALSLAEWTESNTLLIDLEGHGREEIFDNVDLSRTVGWFTTIFPVQLQLDSHNPAQVIRSIKEQLRQIPQRGIGYGLLRYLAGVPELQETPPTEVSFNYLGQFDLLQPAETRLITHHPGAMGHRPGGLGALNSGDTLMTGLASEESGPLHSPLGRRGHLLEVNSLVVDGRLQVEWSYSKNIHHAATIERLATCFIRALQTLIDHCLLPGAGGYTPSDFPEAGLTQPELDSLLAALKALSGQDRTPHINLEAIYPVSPTQQGMIFHTLYAPNSGAYVTQLSYEVPRTLNRAAFQQAWQQVVDRHPVLRTLFVREHGHQPLQVVCQHAELPWVNLDWRDEPEPEQQLDAFLAADRSRGFELDRAPLMRCTLIRLSETTYQFVWTHHHLLIDGWSMPLIFQDVFAFYKAIVQGKQMPLSPPRPYRDYIALLQKQDREQAKIFWQQKLQGFTTPSPLVVDRNPLEGPAETANGQPYDEFIFNLPAEATAGLQALARQNRLTLNTLVQGAWAILLSRYSGEADVLFGTTISGRPPELTGIESMVGLFINALPVRVQVWPETPVLPWLIELQNAQVQREQYWYSLLVDIQGWSDVPRGRLLFESLVVFENYPIDDALLRSQDIQVSSIRSFEQTHYPLTLFLAISGQRLSVRLNYDTSRFEKDTISRMVGHFQTLLTGFVTNRDTLEQVQIRALPILPETEKHKLLVEWNDTRVDYSPSQNRCIHQVFEQQVAQTPGAVAVWFNDHCLTYRELNQKSNQLAYHLISLGVEPGTVVGIYTEPSLEMMIGLLGILKAGGAYVPLDPSYPVERLNFILKDSQASILLTQQHLSGTLSGHRAKEVLLDAPRSTLEPFPTENPAVDISAAQPAYVIYTSGSTGPPKGVIGLHRGAINRFQWMWHTYPFAAGEICCQKTTLSFVDSIWEIFGPLLQGVPTVIMPQSVAKDPHQLVQALAERHVTRIVVVPSLLQAMLTTYPDLQERLRHLKYWTCSGEPLTPELARQFQRQLPNGILLNLYGSSEVAADVTWYDTQGQALSSTVPIGRPIANMQTYILDKQLEPVPIGVPGEIYVSGVGLAQGYINRPDLTAERFIPNPFNTSDESNVAINYSSFLYKTGDLARYRPDGNIEYLGRTDNQVKIRGFRVELGEIEAILNEHPDIQAGVVAANQEQAMLAAYLVPAQAKLAVDDIRVYLSKKLPSYMVPTAFVELASLPLTPNGKIDRRALPLPEKTRLTLSTPFTAPQTPTEMLLANIWRDVLGLEQVGIHDNFFELGGHSLLATQIISRVRDTFSSFMPLHHLFETPTVAGLALVLDNADIQTPLPPIRPMPRTADTELPLSFAQQRLWFLAQLEGPGAAYNIPLAVRISGTLNLTALEQSISKIIERHEVLRTTFHTENGRPYQVIAPSLNLMIPLVDAQASSPQDDEIQRLMLAEAEKPFDLETGPLLRVTVLRLEPQTHVLLVTMHHIISDGWSIGVLVRELSALYQAYVTDTTHPLPDLPIQYADFAGWQRQWLAGEVLETQLNYWKEQLADIPPLLELPTDHPRPAIQSYRGASHAFVLPQSLSAALNALSLKTGTTLFMTLQAAFATLLFRYSGQNDILMGTPVANRNHTEIEPLIGFFVNILVLRTSFEENPTFLTLLNQVRQVSLEAYHHQDLPFELLVDALQPERNLGHTPLFQVLFVLQNVPLEKVELPELTLTPLVSDTTTAKFDLTLMIEEREAGLSGHFEYNTDLFEAATIERMVRHFQTLLAGIVANPNRSVSTLPLLTPAERQQLLTAWGRAITAPQIAAARSVEKAEEFDRTGGTATSSENRPHSPVRHSKIRLFSEKINRSLHELFEAQVDCTPDAPAVSFNGQTLTYQELNLRANRLAHHLIWLGVGPDVLVGLYVERSPELIIGLLAILKAGGAYVPLDPTYPAERLAFMVADAQLPLIITQTPLRNTLQPVLQPEQETQLLCLDTDWKATDPTHAQNPAHTTTAENLAYVIYTSGSTGQPKGVLVTHANVTRLFEATHGWFNFDENDVWTFFHSIAFDFSVWEIWGALLYGGRLVVVPYLTSRSPQEFYQLLGQERVTVLNQTPSAFRQLIQAEASIAATSPEESATLALRLVIFGGEALEPAMLKPWFERHGPTCQLVNMYGITETTVHVTYRPLSPADTQRAGSPIGGPIPDLQLYILDPHLEPVPLGIPGELYVGGAGVSRGYLHCPALTEERFIDNPFGPGRLYKTGDLARYVASGDIEYLGRNDRQVKIRGFRIELGEIATVLNQHQAISEAVVIAGDDPTGPQLVAHQLVAYIVPQTSSDQPAPDLVSEVRAYLSKRLPTYMVPAAIMPLPALPLTPNGKVDYRALPAPEISSTIAFVPPRNPTEETIAAIWRDVLSVDQVGIHDNFFEMGGHSLLAVRLMGHIQQEFEMNFPLAALFQNPTIEQLAILLRRQIDSNSWDCLVPIQPKGDLSPFFWMPGVGGNVIYFYELAQHLNMALAETNNLRPFYGLQAVGLDGESEPYTTVEAMAAHYIESIKTVQPQGPYLLGGHSFGGYVAFEMAQQLMRAGQDVALLAILDAPAPLPNRSKQTLDWDDTRWLMEMIGVVEHMTGINLSISYQTLQSLSAEEQITYIHEQLQMSQLFPSGNDVTLVRGLLQVLKTNSQIHYVPQGILPTQITLFRTGAEDTLWGWDALGAVELYHVPGDHFTMLAEPHVQVLAKQLVALIEGLVDKKAL